MKNVKRIVTVRDGSTGNDLSKEYTLEVYDDLTELIELVGRDRILEVFNQRMDADSRTMYRSELTWTIRNANNKTGS